jgi:hypothetical protein
MFDLNYIQNILLGTARMVDRHGCGEVLHGCKTPVQIRREHFILSSMTAVLMYFQAVFVRTDRREQLDPLEFLSFLIKGSKGQKKESLLKKKIKCLRINPSFQPSPCGLRVAAIPGPTMPSCP